MVGHCNLIEDKDMSALRVCTRCVLPETFPGVHFDKEGVCNFCVNYKGVQNDQIIKAKYRETFDALVKKFKGSGTYDAEELTAAIITADQHRILTRQRYLSMWINLMIVTSGGARKRIGGPQVPVPLLT